MRWLFGHRLHAVWFSRAADKSTRVVRVPADVSLNPDGTLNGDGEVSFNYTDFGVSVPRLLFALPAGKDVTVQFHVTAEGRVRWG